MSTLTFIVLALATHRITRFIVADTLFERVRFWFRGLAMVRTPRQQRGTGEVIAEGWANREGAALVPRVINKIINCHWCSSVYVAAGVLTLYRYESGVFMWVALALAFSSIASVVIERS